jgi:hypothetical protein
MEEVESVSDFERSAYFDRKAAKHTTVKKRRGPSKGGRGKVARLR